MLCSAKYIMNSIKNKTGGRGALLMFNRSTNDRKAMMTTCSGSGGGRVFAGASQLQLATTSTRKFSAYAGQTVTDEDLIKKNDDWVIEETCFNLGRFGPIRYKETDDLARRVKRLMESQRVYMHTRLRDGTCIPYTGLNLIEICDRPFPNHCFTEPPLLKWTWDECYEEAFDDKDGNPCENADKSIYLKS